MAKTTFHRISGALALLHSAPDGDAIRFHPHRTRDLHALGDARSLALAADGGVQLRLEGIDAPELHYRSALQPRGHVARDALLGLAGFTEFELRKDRKTVRATLPAVVPAVFLARRCDAHGRPIAYLFTGAAAEAVPASLEADERDEAILRHSLNAELLHGGAAYPLLYDTQPVAHRGLFTKLAKRAAHAGLGLWPHDRTASGLPLTSLARSARAPLVWPKLFRRVVDYLAARDAGFDGTILEWLQDPLGGAVHDERFALSDGTKVRLRDALRLHDGHVGLVFDVSSAVCRSAPAPSAAAPRLVAAVQAPLGG
jgi:endonuclease YncB( thermonuclease family)